MPRSLCLTGVTHRLPGKEIQKAAALKHDYLAIYAVQLFLECG